MAKVFYRARLAAIVFASVLIAAGAIYHWTFVYNSDYAMIGLMAKRMLDTGDVPIFVWKVGYQGTLVEVPAVAAAYRLFGISPYTLNLAPALFSFILVAVYFRSVRITFGKSLAATAVLLAVVSSPALYGAILRTQPNYPETFIYGSGLFILYLALLKRVFDGRGAGKFPFFLGLLAGWGLYTYGQIVYFLGAIALHASALLFRDLGWRSLPSRVYSAMGSGYWRWPLYLLSAIGLADMAFGLLSLGLGTCQVHIHGHALAWDPVAALTDGIKIGAPAWVAGLFGVYWDRRQKWLPAFAGAGGGFLIGWSPKLYFNWVLHQPSVGKLGSGGDLSLVLSRMRWLGTAIERFFEWTPWNPGTVVLAITFAAAAGAFLRVQMKIWRDVVRKEEPPEALLRISPWSTLPPVVVLAFVTSSSVLNDSYGRYVLVLIYFGAVAVAWAIEAAWRSRRMPRVVLATIWLAVILFHNGAAIARAFNRADARPEWRDIAEDLSAHGPNAGFANYWIAYVARLYTRGEVKLEPLENSYSPEDVVREVEAATPIALVELTGGHAVGAEVSLHGANYVVRESRNVGRYAILTLDKR